MKEEKVLNFLRGTKHEHVSGEEISKKLGVSRSAVWKEIENLRHLGYHIDAEPHRGYRLIAVPDKMFADEIAYGLGNKLIGTKIFSYETLDSTNDAAFKLGEQGVAEGACVFSEHQKKGRGRLGRSWVGPKGKSILLSVLLRPKIAPSQAAKITLTAAVSLVKAVKKMTGQTLGIKWPNDIVHKDKKVCGILTEMSGEADRLNFVVVGIGVNVNSSSKDLPPGSASLKEVAGYELSRVTVAQEFLRQLELDMAHLKKGLFSDLAKDWEEFSATTGRRVTATLLDRKIHGLATGIDSDGALWIRKDNGLQEKIISGDIQHLR